MTVRILRGDCRAALRTLPSESVHCVVTSPPYWGLRDYGVEPSVWGRDGDCDHEWGDRIRKTGGAGMQGKCGERAGRGNIHEIEKIRDGGTVCEHCGAWRGCFGLEPTYQMFVAHAVEVFREVRRVLRPDGTLWLNLGDCYATGAGAVGDHPGAGEQGARWKGGTNSKRPAMGKHAYAGNSISIGPGTQPNRMPQPGLKPKDLVGIPWRVAFALQEDGWWLRQDNIWSKPNPMPESVTDRCTKAHEYLFMLTKSERYYFDQEAIAEPVTASTIERMSQPTLDEQHGSERVPGKTNGPMKAVLKRSGNKTRKAASERGVPVDTGGKSSGAVAGSVPWEGSTRNKRSVWTVTTQPFSEAHFATFPPALIEPCVLAGCPEGGTVLDPFGGAGTTGMVADRLKRNAVLVEINPNYADMAKRRIEQDAGMFTRVTIEEVDAIKEAAE